MKVFNGSHFEDFQFTFNLSSDYMLEERIRSDNWMEIISSFDSHQGYSRLTQETNFHDLGICTRFNMDFLSGKILSQITYRDCTEMVTETEFEFQTTSGQIWETEAGQGFH